MDDTTGKIYLTTLGAFSVIGLSGDGSDIFRCTPVSVGNNTACSFQFFWDGSEHGLSGQNIDDIFIGDIIYPVTCGNAPLNCSFEQISGGGFVNWTIQDNPPYFDWHPSMDSHNGYYGAQGESLVVGSFVPFISSSPVSINPDIRYRISYYSKFSEDFASQVLFAIHSGPDPHAFSYPIVLSTVWQRTEIFFCYPAGTETSWLSVSVGDIQTTGSLFIDDVSIVPQGQCPQLN